MERNTLIAGLLAGTAGLMVFLVIHALWIAPIWFIMPMGLIIAGIGGLAVGWSYSELHTHLPARPWRAPALMVLIMVILLPPLILAELRQPMFFVSAAGVVNLNMGIPEVVLRFIGELLLPATLTAGLLGRGLGGTRRAAWSTALAGFVFALGPGHNIPFIGGTSALGKEIAIITAILAVSSVVLVEASEWGKESLEKADITVQSG